MRCLDTTEERSQECLHCQLHRVPGEMYQSKGKAIYYFKVVPGIPSRFNWHHVSFWIHYTLATGLITLPQIHWAAPSGHDIESDTFHARAFICSDLPHQNVVLFLGIFSSNQRGVRGLRLSISPKNHRTRFFVELDVMQPECVLLERYRGGMDMDRSERGRGRLPSPSRCDPTSDDNWP